MMDERTEPNPTDTIEINSTATVTKRDDYQEQINDIYNCVMEKFPELRTGSLNSPLIVRVKVK